MMEAFMQVVEAFARSENLWKEKIKDWDADSVRVMWNTISPEIYNVYLGPNARRPFELSWKTLYNRMSKKKAFADLIVS